MNLCKQLNMEDNGLPQVAAVIQGIDKLAPEFWPKTLECRLWEYGWIVSNLLKLCGKKKKIRWLDVGSGNSAVPFYLASLGIEVHVTEDKRFRDAFENNRFGFDIKFHSITDAHIPLKSKMFDVVSCISVVEHIENHQEGELMKECSRVLKKNGVMGLTTDLAAIKNYSGLYAGDGSLHWHWYDLDTLNNYVVSPAIQSGLSLLDDIPDDLDFSYHVPDQQGLVIVSLFMRRDK